MMKYESLLNIPEGKIGDWAIKHETAKAYDPITVISMRTFLFTGAKPLKIMFDVPMTYHYLTYKGGTVMSDVPQEQYDHAGIIEKLSGKVLIGGLGLGYVATLLAKKDSITQLIIVEKEQAVIDLVWSHLGLEKSEIVHADIFNYLKTTKEKFDYIYLDVWTGDNELTLYNVVIPLRKLARPLVKSVNRIICWREDVMRDQVKQGCAMKELFKLNYGRRER